MGVRVEAKALTTKTFGIVTHGNTANLGKVIFGIATILVKRNRYIKKVITMYLTIVIPPAL
jgi:hypothetical protein